MEAKEKAARLVEKYQSILSNFKQSDARRQKNYAKLCAIICVDEILSNKQDCGCEQSVVIDGKYQTYITYWLKVKEAITLIAI